MKVLFSIFIALGFVACIILAVEGIFSVLQMFIGLIIFFPLSFIIAQWRNPITVFLVTFLAMLLLYFGIKYTWYGLIPGGTLGVLVTALLSFGWINPHKPFSRKEYIEKMEKN